MPTGVFTLSPPSLSGMTGSLFISRFERVLSEHPDAVAFSIAGQETSYRDFAQRVQAIRQALRARDETKATPVAVYATQELDTYAAIVAIMAEGRAYLPLNPKAPTQRNAVCLQQAEARTVICRTSGAAVEGWTADSSLNVAALETDSLAPANWQPANAIGENDMAYLLFTSGSTGVPKGVPIFHRNLNAFLDAIMAHTDWNVGANDRVLQMFDLTFDLSVMSYALPLCVGGTCVVVPDGSAGFVGVARTLQKGRVTVALMVPSVLTFLERYFDEISLPDLRLSMFCGEALPVALARKWWACAPNARLLNVYGPTEATIFLSAYELGGHPTAEDAYNGVVGIGLPLSGSAFRIVSEDLLERDEGEKGELILIGPQLTNGYWRNPEKTQAAFVTLPDGTAGYRSGDLVFRQGTQYFYAGRIDHQIKIDGYRVESGEIEHRARQVHSVRDAALVPESRDGRIVALHLFVLVDGQPDAGFASACRKELAQHLPSYMVPHKVHARSTFPLNSNGKVDRNALAADIARP
ncbi:MAG TPA: amino acid adenylation domain-containing protein [Gemmatimonas aurantiaca]|nr:amino acid adenylation domain-containing protein [Gemmatimonas aurantiaca]